MYGVVRFLNNDLLPASSPEDYPKIIKSGIHEDGQHYKSPPITGPCGIATLLHKIGRQQLLERLFDTTGTKEFNLRVFMEAECFLDTYIKRCGLNVEIGFVDIDGRWAQHGVRYRIVPEPVGSPYRVGKWIPLSTSDHGYEWGGSDEWVRKQGEAVAKAIWFHEHYDQPKIEVSWSGITKAEKDDLALWFKERAVQLAERRRVELEEYEKRNNKFSPRDEAEMGMLEYFRSQMACRAECGEKNPRLQCAKCQFTRYCSASCQSEDWKYHRSYCGRELAIPEAYLRLLS